MVQLGPDTRPDRPAGGGYEYDDKDLRGFSLSHVSGPGCGAGGDLPMLPVSGDVGSDPASLVQPFSHTGEVAKAGFYQVTTGTGASAVTSKMSTTTRAGIAQFAFPSGADGHLVLKLTDSATPVDGTTGAVIGNREVIASVTTGHFCGQSPARRTTTRSTWTCASSSRSRASHVTGTSANGGPGTIVLDFPRAPASPPRRASPTRATRTRPSTSPPRSRAGTSGRCARPPGPPGTPARQDRGGGGTKDQQVQFYTALYHALLHPNTFSDVNGQYTGFDGKVHTTDPGHVEYATFSGWGHLPQPGPARGRRGPAADERHRALDAPPVRADDGAAAQVGVQQRRELRHGRRPGRRDHRRRLRLRRPGLRRPGGAVRHGRRGHPEEQRPPGQQVRDVKGYLPDDGSYGCCNFYGSGVDAAGVRQRRLRHRLARAVAGQQLGLPAVRDPLAGLGRTSSTPATGYVQAKLADGTWAPGFTPGTSTGMVEGSSSQYTPMVPHNLAALIAGKGGPAKYESFLDSLFTSIDHPGPLNADLSNEPSIEIPWEYDYVGAPWKTQQVVREAQQKLYFNAPVGSFGNDDLGAMSSWYVWSNLGMYPEDARHGHPRARQPGLPHRDRAPGLRQGADRHRPPGERRDAVRAVDDPRRQGVGQAWVPGSRVLQGASLGVDLGGTPNKRGAATSARPRRPTRRASRTRSSRPARATSSSSRARARRPPSR